MLDAVTNDVTLIAATEATIDGAKRKLTVLLTTYIQQFNAGSSHTVMASSLSAYVEQFNQLTALTNQLRGQVTQLSLDMSMVAMPAAESLTTTIKMPPPVLKFPSS